MPMTKEEVKALIDARTTHWQDLANKHFSDISELSLINLRAICCWSNI